MRGIDVSTYQGTIDWAAVEDSRFVEFVYAKATEGTFTVDDQYARNAQVCRERGIPFGAYHFFHFDPDPAIQADHFLNTAQMKSGDLAPMVDVEIMPDGLQAVKAVEILAEFLRRAIGIKFVIYTGFSFWNERMAGSDAFSGHDLWVAEYNDGAVPALPSGWSDWKIWQYSSTGQIPGISGAVDLDRSNGALAVLP